MVNSYFPWQRTWKQWSPQDRSADQRGVTSQGLSTEQIGSLAAAALLAEPGLGKSNELRLIEDQLLGAGETVVSFDLGGFSTVGDINAIILKNSTLTAWRDSPGEQITVLLDGLDQFMGVCPAAASALEQSLDQLLGQTELTEDQYAGILDTYVGAAAHLAGLVTLKDGIVLIDYARLRRLPARANSLPEELNEELKRHLCARRMRLLICCRVAEWPATLNGLFDRLWGDEWRALELAPLTSDDIAVAASAEGLSAEKVLEHVQSSGVEALAERPITLRFLLQGGFGDGSTPITQSSLYERGCTFLCTEWNEARLAAGSTGHLSAEQRLTVAKRLAALSLFGQRILVVTRPQLHPHPSELSSAESAGGTEGQGASQVTVDEQALREVTSTALFSSGVDGRHRWSHQTYPEFLAACFLVESGLSDHRVMQLLIQPGDASGRIAFPLREVAAWIAALRPDMGRTIARRDPAALLYSAALPTSDEEREILLEAILQLEAREDVPYHNGTAERFRRCAHSGVAEQLRPWLFDPQRSNYVRYLATQAAIETQATTLWPELLDLACDTQTPDDVREAAAQAAERLMPSANKPALKRLLTVPNTHTLRGIALQELWPEHLTVAELLDALSLPGRRAVLDPYKVFLYGDSVWTSIKDADLPQVLRWLGDPQGGAWLIPHGEMAAIDWRHTVGHLLRRLWSGLSEPQVVEAFLNVFADRLTSYRGLPIQEGQTDRIEADMDIRRALVDGVARRYDEQSEIMWLVRSQHPLVRAVDVGWVLERALGTEDAERKFWYTLAQQLAWMTEMQEALADRALPPELRALRQEAPNPDAQERARAIQLEREQVRREARLAAQSPFDQQIRDVLQRIRDENPGWWWKIPDLLHVNEERRAVGSDLHHDVRAINGWEQLEPELKDAVIQSAAVFLTQAEFEPPPADTLYGFAGVRALRLLQEEQPDTVAQFEPAVWEKWNPALLAWPPLNRSATLADQQIWIQAYRQAPDAFIHSLIGALTKERVHSTPAVDMLAPLFDSKLEQALLHRLRKTTKFSPMTVQSLMQTMLRCGFPQTLQRALTLMRAHGTAPAIAVAATQALLSECQQDVWDELWSIMQTHFPFAKRLLEGGPNLIDPKYLSEHHLGTLFEWVQGHYPQTGDPEHPPGFTYSPSIRDAIGSWRDSLTDELVRRATPAALEELDRLIVSLPEYSVKLRRQRALADELWLRGAWAPILPQDLLDTLQSARAVLVRDAAQLQELILESLNVLQAELQGANGAVELLWDRTAKGRYRPKDEETLSDMLVRHFKRDLSPMGVVPNREVQIHRRQGSDGVPGERLDLRVDAVARAGRHERYDVVSVLVEVKGSWNDGLTTSMEGQLVQRYMNRAGVDFGLYVVGWPLCPQWDQSDRRRSSTPKWTIDTAQTYFRDQAETVSRIHGVNVQAVVLDIALS